MWFWLVDGVVVPAPKGETLQPQKDRQIKLTEFGAGEGPVVSTVFLGLHHIGNGLEFDSLFETLVMWENNETFDGYQRRYRTLEDAIEGHEETVEEVEMEADKQMKAFETMFGEIESGLFGNAKQLDKGNPLA